MPKVRPVGSIGVDKSVLGQQATILQAFPKDLLPWQDEFLWENMGVRNGGVFSMAWSFQQLSR